MRTPRQIQELVAHTVHAYPSAQIELDPLPTGICFLWVTMNRRNFSLQYHPVDGVGVSENTPDSLHFAGHQSSFASLDEGVAHFKKLLASAQTVSAPVETFERTTFRPESDLKSLTDRSKYEFNH